MAGLLPGPLHAEPDNLDAELHCLSSPDSYIASKLCEAGSREMFRGIMDSQ